jgi:5-methylcytosine-specific restriction endonuclease McrA
VADCDGTILARRMCRRHYRAEVPDRRRHRDYRFIGGGARRAKAAGVEFENLDPRAIYERDGWVCGICGGPIDKTLRFPNPDSPSIDHIIPLVAHGPHAPWNLQAAHLGCNVQKGRH